MPRTRKFGMITADPEIANIIRRAKFPGRVIRFRERKIGTKTGFELQCRVNQDQEYQLLDVLGAFFSMRVSLKIVLPKRRSTKLKVVK